VDVVTSTTGVTSNLVTTSTYTSTSTPESSPSSKSKSIAGPVAGGVVGGICAIALAVGLVYFFRRRNDRKAGALGYGRPLMSQNHELGGITEGKNLGGIEEYDLRHVHQ